MSNWVRSSFCIQGDCVEVFWAGGAVNVRDSKLGLAWPIQHWSPEQWEELLDAIHAGRDHSGVEMVVANADPVTLVPGEGASVRLGLTYAGHERLTFDLAEWQAFLKGVWAGEFALGALQASASSPVPQDSPAGRDLMDSPESRAVATTGQPGAEPKSSPAGRLSDQPSSGGAVRVDQPGLLLESRVIGSDFSDAGGMTCGACGKRTGNNHQGHYWKWCNVTRRMEVFHFCCPGACDRAAAWRQAYEVLVERFAELGLTVSDSNAYLVSPRGERWMALRGAAQAMDNDMAAWERATAPLVKHVPDHPLGTGEEEAVGAVSSGGEVGPVFAAGSTDPVDECDGADRPAERDGAE